MGVVPTKFHESNTTEQTAPSTHMAKKRVIPSKSKCKAKEPTKILAVKRVYQACMKKSMFARTQTPLVKQVKGRKTRRFGHYHQLNEKLNQDEEDEETEDSVTLTSSEDLDSQ